MNVVQKEGENKMTKNDIENKTIYDLKNLLFKAVVNSDKKLEKAVKEEIQKRVKV